jgi:hypothetical protein
MATRATYDVTPQNGGWLIRLAGDSVSEWYEGKADAVRRARELGRRCDEWNVRVYAPGGALEQELTSKEAQ